MIGDLQFSTPHFQRWNDVARTKETSLWRFHKSHHEQPWVFDQDRKTRAVKIATVLRLVSTISSLCTKYCANLRMMKLWIQLSNRMHVPFNAESHATRSWTRGWWWKVLHKGNTELIGGLVGIDLLWWLGSTNRKCRIVRKQVHLVWTIAFVFLPSYFVPFVCTAKLP